MQCSIALVSLTCISSAPSWITRAVHLPAFALPATKKIRSHLTGAEDVRQHLTKERRLLALPHSNKLTSKLVSLHIFISTVHRRVAVFYLRIPSYNGKYRGI